MFKLKNRCINEISEDLLAEVEEEVVSIGEMVDVEITLTDLSHYIVDVLVLHETVQAL